MIMLHRFFTLIYVLAFVGSVLFVPTYFLLNTDFENYEINSYNVRCNANGELVILQGTTDGTPVVYTDRMFIFSEFNNPTERRRELNFQCAYYDEVQKYIDAYISASANGDNTAPVNKAFIDFKNSEIGNVLAYPLNYSLEVISTQRNPYVIVNPAFASVVYGLMIFLTLQFLRISYAYIAFGALVWHPLRSKKRSQTTTAE